MKLFRVVRVEEDEREVIMDKVSLQTADWTAMMMNRLMMVGAYRVEEVEEEG